MQAVASKDASRPALTACRVEQGAVYVTDSYIVARYEDSSIPLGCEYYVNPEMMGAVKPADVIYFGDSGAITSKNVVLACDEDSALAGSNFPNAQKLFDGFRIDAARFGMKLNPKYMARALKIFDAAGLAPVIQYGKQLARLHACEDGVTIDVLIACIRDDGGDEYRDNSTVGELQEELAKMRIELNAKQAVIDSLHRNAEPEPETQDAHEDAAPEPETQDATPEPEPEYENPAVPTEGEYQTVKRPHVSYEQACKTAEAMGLSVKRTNACLWVTQKCTKVEGDALREMGFAWSRKRSRWYLKNDAA
jgi:hypothetical protein